jgi:hypothetical protein
VEDELTGSRNIDTSADEHECIIHIGMHKTGSTSIQRSLHGFSDDRFSYARLARTPNHSLAIYSAFASIPERHHLHRSAGRDLNHVHRYNDRIRKDLDRSIKAARGRTLIISGEDISSLRERDLVKLRDYFTGHFSKLTIVGYVRPPASFLTSSFQQRVKSGRLNFFDLMRMYRSYRATFEKFDRVFGRDNVRLWKFDTGMFPQNDVVSDFCRRLGISLPRTKIFRLNESLSARAVATFYTYNKLGKHAGMNWPRSAGGRALVRVLHGEKFRLSPDSVLPVLEHNHADIEWMEERLGQSLREELGDHRATDFRDEDDLLRPDSGTVAKLLAVLGRSATQGVKGITPQEMTNLVDAVDARQRYRDIGWWWDNISRTVRSFRP